VSPRAENKKRKIETNKSAKPGGPHPHHREGEHGGGTAAVSLALFAARQGTQRENKNLCPLPPPRTRLAPACFRVQERLGARRDAGGVGLCLGRFCSSARGPHHPLPSPSWRCAGPLVRLLSSPREIAGRALLQLNPQRRTQFDEDPCRYGVKVSYGLCEYYRVQANLFSM
jgi:hypothetical protein